MIDWVHADLKEWGYEMARDPKGLPPTSLLHRIMKEGCEGAHAREHRDNVPTFLSLQPRAAETNRIVRQMPLELREAVFAKYVARGSVDKQRAQVMGISRGQFNKILDRAHYFVVGFVAAMQLHRRGPTADASKAGA